ncbi:TRAP transporter small permease [Hydrogenophaga sp. BPS33]|uniref:TRAP transporter small permease n=1 Tax=Hydrogenophaga sp. BPS33 TaxID=2651974 RepID=UPI0013572691|nr:TRAP transporter small permease [Hydrogenophaga sp. BPS33]
MISSAAPAQHPLLRVHDAVTAAGATIAAACLAVIVATYCIEVVSRYFFNAPTTWAGSAVAYLLCASIFLMLPELTRQRAHIFISVLPDLLSQRAATRLIKAGYGVAFFACVLGAWFCADASFMQFNNGIETLNEWRVPKWAVSSFLPYGLLSSGLYFLRHVFLAGPYVAAGKDPA